MVGGPGWARNRLKNAQTREGRASSSSHKALTAEVAMPLSPMEILASDLDASFLLEQIAVQKRIHRKAATELLDRDPERASNATGKLVSLGLIAESGPANTDFQTLYITASGLSAWREMRRFSQHALA
jgi:hypothetical protein